MGWNRCLVWSVAGFAAVPVNKKEKGRKKGKETEKDLWLVAWSLKGETPWRDQSLISAISSTLGTPTSQRCVSVCVCARLAVSENNKIKSFACAIKMVVLLNITRGIVGLARGFTPLRPGVYIFICARRERSAMCIIEKWAARAGRRTWLITAACSAISKGETVSTCPDSPLQHNHLSTLVIRAVFLQLSRLSTGK